MPGTDPDPADLIGPGARKLRERLSAVAKRLDPDEPPISDMEFARVRGDGDVSGRSDETMLEDVVRRVHGWRVQERLMRSLATDRRRERPEDPRYAALARILVRRLEAVPPVRQWRRRWLDNDLVPPGRLYELLTGWAKPKLMEWRLEKMLDKSSPSRYVPRLLMLGIESESEAASTLRKLAISLDETYGIGLCAAVQFVVCGEAPAVTALSGRVDEVTLGPRKIVMEVDPRVPRDVVAAEYAELREIASRIYGTPAESKIMSDKQAELAHFIREDVEVWLAGEGVLPRPGERDWWPELLVRWNRVHGDAGWAYDDLKAFKRSAKDAFKRVTGDEWEPFWSPTSLGIQALAMPPPVFYGDDSANGLPLD